LVSDADGYSEQILNTHACSEHKRKPPQAADCGLPVLVSGRAMAQQTWLRGPLLEKGEASRFGEMVDGKTPLSTSDKSIRAPSTTNKSIGVNGPQAGVPRVIEY